jgi:ElaB/YqjD/DUF883 family membrane-anchored ribosome-binding protein
MNAEELVKDAGSYAASTEKLKADLRILATDLEQFLKVTASLTGQQVAQVRARAEESLRLAKARASELQEVALVRTRAAGRATDQYVRTNPWQVAAICAAAGLLVGLLLARDSEQ